MQDFIRATRSEMRKVLSLRSSLVFAILLTGSLYGPTVLFGLLTDSKETVDWQDLLLGIGIFLFIGLIFGAVSTGAQYASTMHAHAFLTQHRRWNWLGARMLVVAVFLLLNYVIGMLLSVLAAMVLPKLELVNEYPEGLWTSPIAFIGFGLLGVGLASLFQNRTLAIGVPLLWILVVENFIVAGMARFSLLDKLSGWLLNDVVGALSMGEDIGHSIFAMCLWAGAAVLLGVLFNQSRDVQ